MQLTIEPEEKNALQITEAKTQEQKNAVQEYTGLEEVKNLAELLSVGKTIKVVNDDDIKTMNSARETRLKLQKVRTAIEKRRKELKEGINVQSRAVDGMANVFKGIIVPVEKQLEEQEKFVEIKLEKKLREKENERTTRLIKYGIDVSVYNLREMTDEGFEQLAEAMEKAYTSKIEAEKKAKKKAEAEARAEAMEKEKLRLENEKLKKEQVEREKILAEERKARENLEQKARMDKIKTEKKAKEEANAIRYAEAKAKSAPDRIKLQSIVDALGLLAIPEVEGDTAKSVIEHFQRMLAEIKVFLSSQILALEKK